MTTFHGTAEVMGSFRTERYHALNKARWDHFLAMGIPIEGKTVFEPGAGIGDQTQWLLDQGAHQIYVNEGREENVGIIRDRFSDQPRVFVIHGDLESCLAFPEFDFDVDLIFCYGVYYHLREDYPGFTIMRQLAGKGSMIAFDYLAGNDAEVSYGYDNPSTSISQFGFRPRPETMVLALKAWWEFVYAPKQELNWQDPVAAEDRRVLVASHSELQNPNLILLPG